MAAGAALDRLSLGGVQPHPRGADLRNRGDDLDLQNALEHGPYAAYTLYFWMLDQYVGHSLEVQVPLFRAFKPLFDGTWGPSRGA